MQLVLFDGVFLFLNFLFAVSQVNISLPLDLCHISILWTQIWLWRLIVSLLILQFFFAFLSNSQVLIVSGFIGRKFNEILVNFFELIGGCHFFVHRTPFVTVLDYEATSFVASPQLVLLELLNSVRWFRSLLRVAFLLLDRSFLVSSFWISLAALLRVIFLYLWSQVCWNLLSITGLNR